MDVLARQTLAIRLPASYSAPLQELQTLIRRKAMVDLRWVSPSEFFLPLIQLGEQPIYAMAKFEPSLMELCAKTKPFGLGLTSLTGQPNMVQPRYASLAAGGDLESLQRFHNALVEVMSRFVQLGDGRLFTPWVTLGRLRQESEQARVSLGRGLKLTPMPALPEFAASEICLLKATAAEGVSYETLKTYALAGT